eukprot:2580517-Alexandrium_andersonii.AAC.1
MERAKPQTGNIGKMWIQVGRGGREGSRCAGALWQCRTHQYGGWKCGVHGCCSNLALPTAQDHFDKFSQAQVKLESVMTQSKKCMGDLQYIHSSGDTMKKEAIPKHVYSDQVLLDRAMHTQSHVQSHRNPKALVASPLPVTKHATPHPGATTRLSQ